MNAIYQSFVRVNLAPIHGAAFHQAERRTFDDRRQSVPSREAGLRTCADPLRCFHGSIVANGSVRADGVVA